MYSSILIPLSNSEENLGTSFVRQPGSLASRIPRRSLRQVYEVPLFEEVPSSPRSGNVPSFDRLRQKRDGSRVAVSAIPSPDRSCRHNVFIDNGERLKKLDLPSTTSVLVSQRFEAAGGDTLRFDYVVILYSKSQLIADRPSVRAMLVDLDSQASVPLVNRSMDQVDAVARAPESSRFRATQSFTVGNAGAYELRFVTFVDRHFPGSEAHLLVNGVRVLDRAGAEKKRLASLSCVGRVRQLASDEVVN
jgi:hypothetical protein